MIKQIFITALLILILLPLSLYAADPPGIPDGWSNGYVYAKHVDSAPTAMPGKKVVSNP